MNDEEREQAEATTCKGGHLVRQTGKDGTYVCETCKCEFVVCVD